MNFKKVCFKSAFVTIIANFCLLFATADSGNNADFTVSPDASEALLLNSVRKAKSQIHMNIYQFDHPGLTDLLIQKAQAGVEIQLLVEGEPLPKMAELGWATLDRLVKVFKSSKKSQIWVMSKNAEGKRRYRYDHAKYIVMDQRFVYLSSENFREGAYPSSDQPGNRGWQIFLEDPKLASDLERIFDTDTDPKYGDLTLFEARPPSRLTHSVLPREAPKPSTSTDTDHTQDTAPRFTGASGRVTKAQLITSPNSLPGILDTLDSAKETLDLEQMSFPLHWKEAQLPTIINPMIESLIQSSQRGVQVRLLLNDDRVFGGGGPSSPDDENEEKATANAITAKYLNVLAKCKKLPLQARIIDIKAAGLTYIHNKGILVDHQTVVVSSINGTRNSVVNNREAAIRIDSEDANRYYKTVFNSDWRLSFAPKAPVTLLRHLTDFFVPEALVPSCSGLWLP